MTWYISDDFADLRGKNPNSQYRRKWCEAYEVEPVVMGDPLTCVQCGRPISMLRWLEPRRIRLTSSRYPDRIDDCLPSENLVVSERFVNKYMESGLRGIKAFHPLETVRVARNPDNASYPKYYTAEIDYTCDVKIDFERSVIYGRSNNRKCSICNPIGSTIDRIEKIVLDEKPQDKDIVLVYCLGVVMSQRFYDFVEKHNFTNFNLVDISTYTFGNLMG